MNPGAVPAIPTEPTRAILMCNIDTIFYSTPKKVVGLAAYVLESQQRAVERRTLREAEVIGGADQLVGGRDLDDQRHGVEMPVGGSGRRARHANIVLQCAHLHRGRVYPSGSPICVRDSHTRSDRHVGR